MWLLYVTSNNLHLLFYLTLHPSTITLTRIIIVNGVRLSLLVLPPLWGGGVVRLLALRPLLAYCASLG
jgi:hypothetical protein